MLPIKTDALEADGARHLAYSLMDDRQRQQFEADKDANFAVNPEGLGRFRVNVFHQQGMVGMVIRRISSHIPTFKELNLPEPIFEKIAMMRRGLIFFVGGTGTGKVLLRRLCWDTVTDTPVAILSRSRIPLNLCISMIAAS